MKTTSRRVLQPHRTMYKANRRRSLKISGFFVLRFSFLFAVLVYVGFTLLVLSISPQSQKRTTVPTSPSAIFGKTGTAGVKREVLEDVAVKENTPLESENRKEPFDFSKAKDQTSLKDHDAESIIHKNLDINQGEKQETDQGFRMDKFNSNIHSLEAWLESKGPKQLVQPITAYLEGPLNDTVPGTGSRGNLDDKKDSGIPPKFITPLPLRTQTPKDLQRVVYRNVQTCRDMPGNFPVDRGLELDTHGNPVVWNVGDTPTPENFAQLELPFCPVEADPFLPWIHDVFPSPDGSVIHFIAQNRRRCRTGKKFTADVNRLVPQVALLQAVSVERIDENKAQALAPDLWTRTNNSDEGDYIPEPRYRLAPHNESSSDGQRTRFICRFSTIVVDKGKIVQKVVSETLSRYPFDYEMAAYRKGHGGRLLTPKGKDSRYFWTSNLRFDCPVPVEWHSKVSLGQTILTDGTPTLHVDVVPIRTSVRYNEHYLSPEMIGPVEKWGAPGMDPIEAWGPNNVIPKVEASGRWTNIPVCEPPKLTTVSPKVETKFMPDVRKHKEKPHYLSACLWASAEYKTRGRQAGADTETLKRLEEWLEFHFLVGFDHVYVYDNSRAHTNKTTLKPILDKFAGRVTRYDWPSIVCNNNIPAHDSTGERSSQYAAENSCRTRHAPFTEWIASFDTDEYLVPMGNHTSLQSVLREASKHGTNILSFRSSRGYLRQEYSDSVADGKALVKGSNSTYLQAYNCDSAGSPKPSWAERARKQVYRADYVPYHFVHYSTVTRSLMEEYKDNPSKFQARKGEHPPSERVTDELHEAVMVHSKSLDADMTLRYKTKCRADFERKWQGCYVAFPFPENATKDTKQSNQGYEYNCHLNTRVDKYWVPRLQDAMVQRTERKVVT